MRNLYDLNIFRITNPEALVCYNGWAWDETCGAFIIPSPTDPKAQGTACSV